MNATERLLILCTAAAYQPDERAEVSRLAQQDIDWELFQSLAELNATAPLVWKNLVALELLDRVPATVQAQFKEHSETIREANEARLKKGGAWCENFSCLRGEPPTSSATLNSRICVKAS